MLVPIYYQVVEIATPHVQAGNADWRWSVLERASRWQKLKRDLIDGVRQLPAARPRRCKVPMTHLLSSEPSGCSRQHAS